MVLNLSLQREIRDVGRALQKTIILFDTVHIDELSTWSRKCCLSAIAAKVRVQVKIKCDE